VRLELVNSLGCVIDTITDPDKISAFQRAMDHWARYLSRGDEIRVISTIDDEDDQ